MTSRARSQSGVALVLVLYTFAILAGLAGECARAMRDDALSTRNFKLETIGHYVAIAAINEVVLALQNLRAQGDLDEGGAEEDEELDPLDMLNFGDGQWVDGTYNGYDYEVRIIAEGGKVGLNDVTPEILRLMFLNLEYEPDQIDTIADSILDWRDEDDAHNINGAEDDYYEGLERPYPCKDGPFDSVEELLLVRGVTEELYYGDELRPGLQELFSVFNRTNRINLRSVTPAVMIALGGLDEPDAEDLRRQRNENPDGELPPELQGLLSAAGTGSRAGVPVDVTIEARIRDSQDRVISHVGAVMRVGSRGDGLRLYRWYDALFVEDDRAGGLPVDEFAEG